MMLRECIEQNTVYWLSILWEKNTGYELPIPGEDYDYMEDSKDHHHADQKE